MTIVSWEFESPSLHLFHKHFDFTFAEIAQLVEHDLAKVGVASSSLVFRSEKVVREDGFFLCRAVFFLPFAIELVGVVYVVPDAVESSCYGCHRGHESIAHPDGEHRIFLS